MENTRRSHQSADARGWTAAGPTVKMKGESRVPKHWKKQNITINQLSFQTNFLLQTQGMSKNHPVSCPQNSNPPTADAMKQARCTHQTLLKTPRRRSSLWKAQLQARALTPGAVPSAGGQNAGSTRWPQHPQHLGRNTRVRGHCSTPAAAQHPASGLHRPVDSHGITELFTLEGTLEITWFFSIFRHR